VNGYHRRVSEWSTHTLAALRAQGYRSGGARRAVVEELGRQTCCVTAQQLFDALRAQGRPVGVASVYRVLDLLVAKTLVQRIDVGDGTARFEPVHTERENHHHHLVCDDCGRVEAFSDERLERALREAEDDSGYAVQSHEVLLRGACAHCRAA
jgi:Fur family ferric uptake transcriptional regulator